MKKARRKPGWRFIMQFPRLEVVLWDDATTFTGWESLPVHMKPGLAFSVGFLVGETKQHVMLAHSFDMESTNGRIQIPKSIIKKRIPVDIDYAKMYSMLK